MKPNHIVLTTVSAPNVLFDLCANASDYGHADSSMVWVVGDTNTPDACKDTCRKVASQGLDVRYIGIAEQDEWGKRFPKLYGRIPYANESRRNVGFLCALEHGCERMISIDDDNFPTDEDFVGGHLCVGGDCNEDMIEESSGFHNVCEHLEFAPERRIFPRGFPFRLRDGSNDPRAVGVHNGARIGVNSGLWLKAPDVDATTWLNGSVESRAYRGPSRLVLGQGTWSPINTQNTCVARELMPAFPCIPMGEALPGGAIERYGDIWGGYFLQSVLSGTPYHVCFGHPLVEHRRNPHDYVEDLRHEFWGMVLTDWLITLLREEFRPSSDKIADRCIEISELLRGTADTCMPQWCPREIHTFFSRTAEFLDAWVDACRTLA